jgi:hypothetical protein
MNERIRELSEQAEKYADDNFRGEPTWSEAFESKFAELIVRECAAYMYSTYPNTRYEVNYMRKHMGDSDWNKPIGGE